jgi:GTP cyclohydrolase IA
MAVDRAAAAGAIAAFLRALGHDPMRDPELEQTPERVTEAFADDLLSGYDVDVEALISAGMSDGAGAKDGIVVVRDIAVATVCPHHLLPALGHATVAYLPGARLLGIGTIARLVDAYARRLTVQEAIGENVVNALGNLAGARGAYCDLDLVHSCLSARGARQTGARVRSVATLGRLAGPAAAAELTLALGRPPAAESEGGA